MPICSEIIGLDAEVAQAAGIRSIRAARLALAAPLAAALATLLLGGLLLIRP